MKTFIVALAILLVAAIALVSPYTVTTGQIVSQTQSYTSQFAMTTTSTQMQTVYTLPSPITILGAQSIMIGLLSPWKSSAFSLQAGLSLSISVTLPSSGYAVFVWENFAPFDRINYTLNGVLQGYTAVVPQSGSYYVTISNLNTSPITISTLSVAQSASEAVQLTQTVTVYDTTIVSQSLETIVPLYTVLGTVASAIILVLLAVVLALSILLDRGIIMVSKSRKKRKQ